MTMTEVKAHVRDDNTATLSCPACGTSKQITAEQFRHGRHTISVRCRCQQVFSVLLDFRRHYHKQVKLVGTYEHIGLGATGGGIIHIDNISMGGVGCVISGLHQIAEGQELLLEFQLDDKKKTMLKKRVIVQSVRHDTVGCVFKDPTDIEKALGFYLRH
jgi:hypothetical protein